MKCWGAKYRGSQGGSDTPGLTLETKLFFFLEGGVSGKSLKNYLSLAIVKKKKSLLNRNMSSIHYTNCETFIVSLLWCCDGPLAYLFAPPFQVCGIGARGCPLGLTGSTRAQCRQSLFKLPLHGPLHVFCLVLFSYIPPTPHFSHNHSLTPMTSLYITKPDKLPRLLHLLYILCF